MFNKKLQHQVDTLAARVEVEKDWRTQDLQELRNKITKLETTVLRLKFVIEEIASIKRKKYK